MSRELEPCPFCPDGEFPIRLKKDGKPTGTVAHACYALGIEIRVPEHVWQTRYKRTCKLIMREGSPACSECLAEQDYEAKFCDQCGAEVVDVPHD